MSAWTDFYSSQSDLEKALGRPLSVSEKIGLWWDGVVNSGGVVGTAAKSADAWGGFVNNYAGPGVADATLGATTVTVDAVTTVWNLKWFLLAGLALAAAWWYGLIPRKAGK